MDKKETCWDKNDHRKRDCSFSLFVISFSKAKQVYTISVRDHILDQNEWLWVCFLQCLLKKILMFLLLCVWFDQGILWFFFFFSDIQIFFFFVRLLFMVPFLATKLTIQFHWNKKECSHVQCVTWVSLWLCICICIKVKSTNNSK